MVSMMTSDLEDSTEMYNLLGYQALGEVLFGKKITAEQVLKMKGEDIADVLEEWSEVPMNVQAIVEYDPKRGKCRVSPYKLNKMPLDYLTEYE